MTCKRCNNLPTAPTREYGDTRWPASIAGYCIECVWVIVQEWERIDWALASLVMAGKISPNDARFLLNQKQKREAV